MSIAIILLTLVMIVAFMFEYVNGFHDSANAISTVVSTKALSPRRAIIYAAVLDFTGAFFGTHVAHTIGAGMVSPESVTQLVILAALLGAITWNLLTWYLGLPSSSSHALIGGLLGAALTHAYLQLDKAYELILKLPSLRLEHPSLDVINGHNVVFKVLIPMIASPVLGFCVGFLVILVLLKIFYKMRPELLNRLFRKLQLFSSGFLAFSHGSNDAQKTMGIITLSLMTFGVIQDKSFHIPIWVICACAMTLSLGTMTGGWKIIRTMSSKVIKMKPIHGFSVEIASAGIILTASHFGFPVSTTHIISTAIMGVGSMVKVSAVRWGIVKNIVVAWVCTIPICMFLSGLFYFILMRTPLANCGG
ncbi:MAG: inorganic phosphate transporter [Candidatus Gastranaerophilales bacterium]|nr:inorganic phosphate transporter [Candidatus Gastranaerophilales bacterium]